MSGIPNNKGALMTGQLYHLANIRDLLINGFDDTDLRRLCFDVPDFRPVYNRLARNTGKAQIVDELMEYSEKTLQIDTLLALAKERNPARYEEHAPYYAEDPTPALQKQVSDLARRLAALASPTSLTQEQQVQIAFHWQELGGKDSLRGFDLQGSDLTGVNLSEAILFGADLREASLRMADLQRTDLRTANLSKADLSDACLREASLLEADLSGAKLRSVNLEGADLQRANLGEADLGEADLRMANLREASLSGADLQRADLTGANLQRATLLGAKVTDGQLAEAWTLEGATLPNGRVHE